MLASGGVLRSPDCSSTAILDVALETLLGNINSTACRASDVTALVVPTTWDRIITAYALSQLNPTAAAGLVNSVLTAQHSDGLVPHISYDASYIGNCAPFPPQDVWRVDGVSAASSGLASPPLLSTVVLAIFYEWLSGPKDWPAASKAYRHSSSGAQSSLSAEANEEAALNWVASVWESMFASYNWIFSHRCVGCQDETHGVRLYWLASPWESAVPASASWAQLLEAGSRDYIDRMSSNATRVWNRMQTMLNTDVPSSIADGAAFPGWDTYNASWLATACVVGCSYDSTCVLSECPFVIASAADNALLARAIVDLQTLMQWLQTSGPAPKGSAAPTVSQQQADAVASWSRLGLSTADSIVNHLFQPSTPSGSAWFCDAASAYVGDARKMSHLLSTMLQIQQPVGRDPWVLLDNTSCGSAAAVLGMPDTHTAVSSDWRAALMFALANDPAWSQPRLVSLSRTDAVFNARFSYSGALWSDVTWLLWAALTSTSDATSEGQGAALLAKAIVDDVVRRICDAWDGVPVQTRVLYGAFDAQTSAPLPNSTAAYSGGGTGLVLPAVTILTLRPPAVPVPIPSSGGMPGLPGIVIAMCAELLLVAGVALGCAVLGGQQVHRLTTSSGTRKRASSTGGGLSGDRSPAYSAIAETTVNGSINTWQQPRKPSPVVGEPIIDSDEDDEAEHWVKWYRDDADGDESKPEWADADILGHSDLVWCGCRRRRSGGTEGWPGSGDTPSVGVDLQRPLLRTVAGYKESSDLPTHASMRSDGSAVARSPPTSFDALRASRSIAGGGLEAPSTSRIYPLLPGRVSVLVPEPSAGRDETSSPPTGRRSVRFSGLADEGPPAAPVGAAPPGVQTPSEPSAAPGFRPDASSTDVTAAVLQRHSTAPISSGEAGGGGLLRSVLSLPGALWTYVASGVDQSSPSGAL